MLMKTYLVHLTEIAFPLNQAKICQFKVEETIRVFNVLLLLVSYISRIVH